MSPPTFQYSRQININTSKFNFSFTKEAMKLALGLVSLVLAKQIRQNLSEIIRGEMVSRKKRRHYA
jgi:hypothetical protein